LLPDLEKLVDSTTRGDPMSPLRWTSKSVRKLTVALNAMGHRVGRQKVCELLHKLKFSLQSTRKTHEGGHHPDRDAQFQHINATAELFLEKGLPVISVDAKKKELVGNFKNQGREWQPKGQPEQVNVYDFVDEGGKATPYGVYDIFRNEGWVNVGITADTSEFAVQSIRDWWNRMGKLAYPDAGELMITADGGGSNGYRVRLWKLELQKLADETGLHIVVCHYGVGQTALSAAGRPSTTMSITGQRCRGRSATAYCGHVYRLRLSRRSCASSAKMSSGRCVNSSMARSERHALVVAGSVVSSLNVAPWDCSAQEPCRGNVQVRFWSEGAARGRLLGACPTSLCAVSQYQFSRIACL
jgi:hypothetical protein